MHSSLKVVFWPSIARNEISERLRGIAGAELATVESADELAAALPGAQVLVIGGHFYGTDVAAAVRAHANDLRFIQSFTAGYEGLQAQGVPPGVLVANAGDAWSPGVAEHAMAMLLGLSKRLHEYAASQARGLWDRGAQARMGSLSGQTVAIVGFGSIGREFARLVRPFCARILGVSRSARRNPLVDEIHPATALKTVLARADVVLLSVPYSNETHHLIGRAELAACKRGALLINVARGGLIDQSALVAALMSGALGGAALDVTDPEPLPPGDPLWGCPNLILTPHVAGASGLAGRRRLAETIAANVARFAAGQPPSHLVSL